jgi:hypothetical protein
MMRINTGIVCVVAALAVAACSWGSGSSNSGGPTPDAPGTAATCGDNICAASEVNYCPQDCGSGGGGNQNAVCGNGQCETTKGESATSCPSDCGGGNGSGSGSGNGSNTGSLNCSDQNVLLACFACIATNVCTPPEDAVSCQACLGGGLGSGACNNDGVCDTGETSAACPLDNCP